MTVLTRIPLNPLRRGTQQLLTNPQRLHAAVAGTLPSDATGEGRILWRLDRHDHQVDLYVQAPETPSMTHLIDQAGWPDSPSGQPRTADLQPLYTRLQAGQIWGFRTTLNPVSSISQGGKSSGQRGTPRPHTTPEHQLRWFLDRADGRHGFTCTEFTVQLLNNDTLKFTKDHGSRPVTLHTATFQGTLSVTDPDALRRILTFGLGRARAYGCGLITLARA